MLRKRWLAGSVSDRRFAAAVGDLGQLDLDRYPARPFMQRGYQLRANVMACAPRTWRSPRRWAVSR